MTTAFSRSLSVSRCSCIRRFEEKCAELYRLQARSAASCISTSARRRSRSAPCHCLRPEDAIVATYREHGHALVRGIPPERCHGGDVRQSKWLQRADAAVRCICSTCNAGSSAAMPSSAAGCRWPLDWRWPTSCSNARE